MNTYIYIEREREREQDLEIKERRSKRQDSREHALKVRAHSVISRSRLPIFHNHTRLIEIPIPAQKEPYVTMEKEPCCTCKRALQSKEPLDRACRFLTTILGSSKFQYLQQNSTIEQWKKSLVLHTKESKEPCCAFKRALHLKEPYNQKSLWIALAELSQPY